jgi:hypothetical protein
MLDPCTALTQAVHGSVRRYWEKNGQGRFSPNIRFINIRVTRRAGMREAVYPMVAIMRKRTALAPYPVSGNAARGVIKYAATSPIRTCQASGENKM